VRTYHAKGLRVLSDGSFELEGPWSAVRFISLILALALALLLVLRNRLLAFPALAFSVYFMVMPTRRRVIFDRTSRVLRIEHAGPFRETENRTIPFDQIRSIHLEDAGRARGRPLRAAFARTNRGEVYLITLGEDLDDAPVRQAISSLLDR